MGGEGADSLIHGACTHNGSAATMQGLGRQDVILCGIEAHVCVLQTCMDLLDKGYKVHLVVDGISSQRAFDRQVALQRMEQEGAKLTTSESVIFQMAGSADHPHFKAISSIAKSMAKEGNSFWNVR
jgi:nicotinamidase-related amidase